MQWKDLEEYMNKNEILFYPLYTRPRNYSTGESLRSLTEEGENRENVHESYDIQNMDAVVIGLGVSKKDNVLAIDPIGDVTFAVLEYASKVSSVPKNWIIGVLNHERAIHLQNENRKLFLIPPYQHMHIADDSRDISRKHFYLRWEYFNEERLKRIKENIRGLKILPKLPREKREEFLKNNNLKEFNKIYLPPSPQMGVTYSLDSYDILKILREKTNSGTVFYVHDLDEFMPTQELDELLKKYNYRRNVNKLVEERLDLIIKKMKEYDLIIDQKQTQIAQALETIYNPHVFRNEK